MIFFFFFFNDTATTEIYTLSLHDALPISVDAVIPGNPERARLDADIDLVPGLKAVKVVCIDGEALVFLPFAPGVHDRSEEHTSELQSRLHLVCRLLLEKKKKKKKLT